MNLYEYEGKNLFSKSGITIPHGFIAKRGDDVKKMTGGLIATEFVVKSQILSGKRGKNGGIKFCSSVDEMEKSVEELFDTEIRGQFVASVLVEEKLEIVEEHYMSITYDTKEKKPMLIYSTEGGVDIEDVDSSHIAKKILDVRERGLVEADFLEDVKLRYVAEKLWQCFLDNDCRLVEINPLAKVVSGEFVAADAKVAIDDDAFYRHREEWSVLEPRTEMGRPPTDREMAVRQIDAGADYYRGTAGKYIEMDGDIAILFSGGGASIANMDTLIKSGLKPANYTEYSGNPPREKVYELAKIVLSKPGLRGLWIAGGVANFTNVRETFAGIVDALDEIKPTYPIVVRRAGPFESEGMELMRECGQRNGLNMRLFGKEMSMSETASELVDMVI
jgi:citryl-CoA synthetase large subunit